MSKNLEDILELSDEEFLAQQHQFESFAQNALNSNEQEEEETGEEIIDPVDEVIPPVEADSTDDLDSEQTDDTDLPDGEAGTEESPKGETEEGIDADAVDNLDDVSKPDTDADIDYKAEYQKVLAPFKANGRTIKVDSVDDAVALMQMGANYNKKMSDLKPHLKIVKTLEANGLLDADKINNLIDLSKKDVGAIKKLVKDSGIDTFELNNDEENTYKPKNHQIDDRTMNLSDVLDNLRGTDKFDVTSDIVGSKWDEASRAALYENPGVINVIHQHVQSGQYEVIADKVEQLRALGRLPAGASDLDAYGVVAKAMAEQAIQPQVVSPVAQEVQKPVPKADAEREKKRKAAAGTKKVPGNAAPTLTPDAVLAMSDAEFEKASADGLFKTI